MDPNIIAADLSAFGTALSAWAASALPNLLAAVLMLVAGWWAAVWAQRALGRVLDSQTRVDVTVRAVVLSLARYAILVVVLVAALGQLGVQTTSIFAALGAIGLAVGLALQGTLANVAAGFMLLWLRPFKVGDYIDAGGIAGTLHEVGIFACQIHTWDGIFQFVPNGELWNKRVVNYSRLPNRLVDLKVGIGYGDSIADARKVLMKVAASDQRVYRDPPPQVFVHELGDSAVVMALRVWADTANYWDLRRALTEQAKLQLEGAGLTIPFPQRDVHVHGTPVNGAARAPAANAA
jgi:small conductance mechanosensitive channel